MNLKDITEKRSWFYLITLAIIILAIPHIVRFMVYDNTLMGFEPYYHARMAKQISEHGIPVNDSLSYSNSPYIFNPYHLIMATLSSIIPLDILLKILPFLLGILCLILFHGILKKLKLTRQTRFFTSLIFITSPIFIYFFTLPNPHSIPLFLNLAAFYFFLSEKKYLLLSFAAFILLPLFGFAHAIVGFLILLSYGIINRKMISKCTFLFMALLLASLLHFIPFYLKYSFPRTPNFITFTIFNSFISDLGSWIAFGFFILFLSIMGIITMKKNYQNIIFYLSSLLLLISSYYVVHLRIYLNLLFSFLVATAILMFIKRRWKLKLIKYLTILTIICGLLFSTISYLNRLSTQEPDKSIIASLEWLENKPTGVVFSHYEKGFWIEHLANKPVIMDAMFDYAPNVGQRYNDSLTIFFSRNLQITTEILDKYNVTYIWIDKKMKHGQVWEKENQGLLFLLKNSERFKSIYALEGVEIWTYIK